MKHTVAPAARAEVRKAVEFYWAEGDKAIARAFVEAIESGYATICRAPDRWPTYPDEDRVRRYLVPKPFDAYAIIYRITRRGVRILAVAHQRRRAAYWRRRR